MKAHEKTRNFEIINAYAAAHRWKVTDKNIEWVINTYTAARTDLFTRKVTEKLPGDGERPVNVARLRTILDRARHPIDSRPVFEQVISYDEVVLSAANLAFRHNKQAWDAWMCIANPRLSVPSKDRIAIGWWQNRTGREVLVGITCPIRWDKTVWVRS